MGITLREEVIQVLKEMPDLTLNEIGELTSVSVSQGLSGQVTKMYRAGELDREKADNPSPRKGNRGRWNKVYRYRLAQNPDMSQRTNRREIKLKEPTDAGWKARIAEKDKIIQSLQTWKQNAIERHPDLAVSELVIQARKIAASSARENGDNKHASEIESGKCDHTLLVKSVIAALESAAM